MILVSVVGTEVMRKTLVVVMVVVVVVIVVRVCGGDDLWLYTM